MITQFVHWAQKFDQPPVGRCLRVELSRDDDALLGDFEFFDDGPDGFATRIRTLYEGRFLNAISIGLQIVRAGPPDTFVLPPHVAECKGFISAANLIEVSAVPIGSNPKALVHVAKSLRPWLVPQAADPVEIDRLANRVIDRLQGQGVLSRAINEAAAEANCRTRRVRPPG